MVELDRVEYEAGLRCCWNILAKLGEIDGISEPDLDQGECGECGRQSAVRWTLGQFELCRTCRSRRRRVEMRLEPWADTELVDELRKKVA